MNKPPERRIRSREVEFDSKKLTTLRGRLSILVESHENGMRLDRFLASRMAWRSRTKIEQLIDEGKVELEGRSARASRKVRTGEEILVTLPKPKRDLELEATGGEISLPILYEDADLVAVDKPPGIPVHPGGRLLHRTVITELHHRYRVYDDPERDIIPKLCHRLDLETSGVLLVGKSDAVVAKMGRQLHEHTTEKHYLALVHGNPMATDWIMDEPIGSDEHSAVQLKRRVRADGQSAKTGVRVLQHFEGFSLVRLRLYSGRRHQIRVHLSHAGFPIVGDKLYGLSEDYFLAYYEERMSEEMSRQLLLPRQALHAERLVFEHPRSAHRIEIESPLAEDLQAFMGTLASA